MLPRLFTSVRLSIRSKHVKTEAIQVVVYQKRTCHCYTSSPHDRGAIKQLFTKLNLAHHVTNTNTRAKPSMSYYRCEQSPASSPYTREQSPACHTIGASKAQHPLHIHASKAQHVIAGASKAQHPVTQNHHYSPKPDVTHGVKAPLKSYSYSTQNIHMVGGA